jgi:hypothetical protein
MAGRTQDRCRGECSGHGTDDTADSHGRLSIDCAVTKRDGAGRGRRLTPSCHVDEKSVLAGAGPMGRRRRSPCNDPGDPPVRIARWDSLSPSRATGPDLSRSQFAPGRTRQISPPTKRPLLPQPTGTRQKICDHGRLSWQNPVSPITAIGIRKRSGRGCAGCRCRCGRSERHQSSKTRSIRAAAA